MPLYRYRTFEEARRALWLQPGDPRLAQEWRALYELSMLAPPAPPTRGLRRFVNIEDANRDSEEWIARRVAAGRARVVEPD